MTDFCRAQWPNRGPAGGLWTCTLDAGHDGDHEARGPGGVPCLSSPSSIIPQGHEEILRPREPGMTGTRKPYDVYGKLEDPVGVLSVALARWETRDDSKPQPEVRRAANTAMDAIDAMLRELHAMRARLVGEIRAADDAAVARADRLLAEAGVEPGAVIASWCKGCHHAAPSVPCGTCGGPACANCRRCPDCDGPVSR